MRSLGGLGGFAAFLAAAAFFFFSFAVSGALIDGELMLPGSLKAARRVACNEIISPTPTSGRHLASISVNLVHCLSVAGIRYGIQTLQL
jgi:hypothetical protein